jgi:IS5 family transposase
MPLNPKRNTFRRADNASGTHRPGHTIFEVFAGHEIGCELKAITQWLDGQRALVSLVAGDLRRHGLRETGRHGLPAETVLRSALLKRCFALTYLKMLASHLHCSYSATPHRRVWNKLPGASARLLTRIRV